jgi:hypothetical protein
MGTSVGGSGYRVLHAEHPTEGPNVYQVRDTSTNEEEEEVDEAMAAGPHVDPLC